MAISVNDLYLEVCDALLEPGGLTGQTITVTQFLEILNDCLRDFFESSNCFLKLNNVVAELGVRVYSQDWFINQPQTILCDESNIQQGSGNYWDNSDYRWQQLGPGTPQEWRNDELQEDQFEVRPSPAWNGYQVNFAGGFYGTFSATSDVITFDVNYDPASAGMYGTISSGDYGAIYPEYTSPMYGIVANIIEPTLNFTQITTYTLDQEIGSLDEYIPDVPDSLKPCIRFMTLARIYATDGEEKCESLAKYYSQRSQETIRILRSVSQQVLLEV